MQSQAPSREGQMFDLLVRGGTVVTAESSALLDIAVEGERIVQIAPPGVL